MSLIIKELWIKNQESEWKPVQVISLYKAALSRGDGNEVISTEQMFAICYYETTGEIIEVPLNESIIKTLEDGKNRKSQSFSAPVE